MRQSFGYALKQGLGVWLKLSMVHLVIEMQKIRQYEKEKFDKLRNYAIHHQVTERWYWESFVVQFI